jgi:hypothetical protein
LAVEVAPVFQSMVTLWVVLLGVDSVEQEEGFFPVVVVVFAALDVIAEMLSVYFDSDFSFWSSPSWASRPHAKYFPCRSRGTLTRSTRDNRRPQLLEPQCHPRQLVRARSCGALSRRQERASWP